MPRKVAVLALLCVMISPVLSSPTTTCWAKRVKIRRRDRVYVRVPLVRADVRRYGRVSVRWAPVAAVGRPARRMPPPVATERRVERPPLPTTSALVALDEERLMRTLRLNSDQLYEQLSHIDTGSAWRRYLRLPNEALDDGSADPQEQRAALRELLDRFRHVASERQYSMITQLPAFAAMQTVLTEVILRLDESAVAWSTSPEALPLPEPIRQRR
jgi:hypothetical protein